MLKRRGFQEICFDFPQGLRCCCELFRVRVRVANGMITFLVCHEAPGSGECVFNLSRNLRMSALTNRNKRIRKECEPRIIDDEYLVLT